MSQQTKTEDKQNHDAPGSSSSSTPSAQNDENAEFSEDIENISPSNAPDVHKNKLLDDVKLKASSKTYNVVDVSGVSIEEGNFSYLGLCHSYKYRSWEPEACYYPCKSVTDAFHEEHRETILEAVVKFASKRGEDGYCYYTVATILNNHDDMEYEVEWTDGTTDWVSCWELWAAHDGIEQFRAYKYKNRTDKEDRGIVVKKIGRAASSKRIVLYEEKSKAATPSRSETVKGTEDNEAMLKKRKRTGKKSNSSNITPVKRRCQEQHEPHPASDHPPTSQAQIAPAPFTTSTMDEQDRSQPSSSTDFSTPADLPEMLPLADDDLSTSAEVAESREASSSSSEMEAILKLNGIMGTTQGNRETFEEFSSRFFKAIEDNTVGKPIWVEILYPGDQEPMKTLIHVDPIGRKMTDSFTFNGNSPMHVAVIVGHEELVRLLLMIGSSVDKDVDFDGNTPLQLAHSKGQRETVRMLLKAGGNVQKIYDQALINIAVRKFLEKFRKNDAVRNFLETADFTFDEEVVDHFLRFIVALKKIQPPPPNASLWKTVTASFNDGPEYHFQFNVPADDLTDTVFLLSFAAFGPMKDANLCCVTCNDVPVEKVQKRQYRCQKLMATNIVKFMIESDKRASRNFIAVQVFVQRIL